MDAGVSVERRGADHDHAAAPRSYQPRDRFTIATTESITGTSTSTPTTVASAAPDFRPNSEIAAATASSTKRSEEHTSELQSLMRNSYAVFCLKKTHTHKPNKT